MSRLANYFTGKVGVLYKYHSIWKNHRCIIGFFCSNLRNLSNYLVSVVGNPYSILGVNVSVKASESVLTNDKNDILKLVNKFMAQVLFFYGGLILKA